MKLSIGYMTFPTKSEAQNTVLALLEEGLIACANLITGVESLFVWENEIQKANEVVVVFKTRRKNEDKVVKMVKQLHSYETPCVVFTPIENGNPQFMDWVEGSC
jgi:periplasmic divalent cation tolerance protein